jgi:hypothetical protein
MELVVVPLLAVARELYETPRGMERFQQYLRTLTNGPDDVILPLVSLNPMGREHVVDALDALLALDAEGIAVSAVEEAERRLRHVDGDLRVGLTLADDVAGGWTQRSLTDMRHRFDVAAALKRRWAVALFWTSDTPTIEMIRAETLSAIYRSVYAQRHGIAGTLQQMLTQEGLAARFAGVRAPDWSTDDLAAIRTAIEPYLQRTETPVTFACLYGDDAAHEVGYPPLGLPANAGFDLAIVEAQAQARTPEAHLTSG